MRRRFLVRRPDWPPYISRLVFAPDADAALAQVPGAVIVREVTDSEIMDQHRRKESA